MPDGSPFWAKDVPTSQDPRDWYAIPVWLTDTFTLLQPPHLELPIAESDCLIPMCGIQWLGAALLRYWLCIARRLPEEVQWLGGMIGYHGGRGQVLPMLVE